MKTYNVVVCRRRACTHFLRFIFASVSVFDSIGVVWIWVVLWLAIGWGSLRLHSSLIEFSVGKDYITGKITYSIMGASRSASCFHLVFDAAFLSCYLVHVLMLHPFIRVLQLVCAGAVSSYALVTPVHKLFSPFRLKLLYLHAAIHIAVRLLQSSLRFNFFRECACALPLCNLHRMLCTFSVYSCW